MANKVRKTGTAAQRALRSDRPDNSHSPRRHSTSIAPIQNERETQEPVSGDGAPKRRS